MRYLLHAMIEVEALNRPGWEHMSKDKPATIVQLFDLHLRGMELTTSAQHSVRVIHTTVTQAEQLP